MNGEIQVDLEASIQAMKEMAAWVGTPEARAVLTLAENAAHDALIGLLATGVVTGLFLNKPGIIDEIRDKIVMAFDIGYYVATSHTFLQWKKRRSGMSVDAKIKMTLEWTCPEGHLSIADITKWRPGVHFLTCLTCENKHEFTFMFKSGEPWVEWVIA